MRSCVQMKKAQGPKALKPKDEQEVYLLLTFDVVELASSEKWPPTKVFLDREIIPADFNDQKHIALS